MHADEVRATPDQVRRLIAAQRPDWAELVVTALPTEVEGTDHVLFRVGQDLLARMPKIGWAVDQADSDATWLERLAPSLPAALPVPLHVGEPGEGFPWRWSVVRWFEGTTPPRLGTDDVALARDLAGFVGSLHAVAALAGPATRPGTRGASLRHVDGAVRAAIVDLQGHEDGFDPSAAHAVWDRCLGTPEWSGPPVWIHGDLQPGNLIVDDRGRLVAVIDWGALGVTDPAPDLAAAWWTFTGAARAAYRSALDYDDATWTRALGWALAPSLTGIGYYRETFPRMAEHGRRVVCAVLAEPA